MTNYTYSKISAANFNTSPATVARSATGSVYAIGDTTYTTPLNMTLVVGGSVVTSISSDTNGYFPDFTLLDRTSCVWKQNSVAFATVLTTTDPVPGPPGASGGTGATGAQGVPGDVSTWKPTTFYPLNTPVTNPSGDLVKVTTAHTSTSSYDATKFAPTGADATKLTGVVPDTNLRADLTVAALSATIATATAPKLDKTEAASSYAPIRATLRGNRAVFLGDSITIAQSNDTPTGTWGISYPTYATYFSKGRLLRVRNSGISGNRASDMLARFDADVTPFAPSLVAIMAGTNDWNDAGPTTLADYQTTMRALVAKCRAIGAQPILCTVPPNLISSARQKRTIIGNTWLRAYCAQQGIQLVDFYNLFTDPATGGFLAAYALDGTHPNNAGYVAMGKFFWDSISAAMPAVDSLLPMENADPNNLLTNGLNLTTTGSGASLMPTGWSVQTSVHGTGTTGSLVTGDTAIKGNWWKVAADGTANTTNNEFLTVSGATVIPGHTYAQVGRFKATGLRNADTGSGSGFLLGLAFNSVLLNGAYDFRPASTHYYDVAEGIYYQEVVAPSDATTILVRRQLLNTTAGAGTLQVAQQGLYDLTAMGLAP